jgi:hypothetical protein
MESSQFQEKAHKLQQQIGPGIDEAKENLAELNERVVGFIKQNPGTCLLGALAVGFLVGRIASR